jgi:hypothetical protein
MDNINPRPPTYRAQMKVLKDRLHFAQLHYRLDLFSLHNAKVQVLSIARRMRRLQKDKHNVNIS